MRSIVVGVDFSQVTPVLMARVAELAHAFGSEVRLVHVTAPDPEFVGYEVGPQVVRDQVAAELRSEHRELQGLAEELRTRGIEAKALLLRGPTVETLLREAEGAEADLVVLGSHGRGALRRALLGSVSEGVLRRTGRPLLIVPCRDGDDG